MKRCNSRAAPSIDVWAQIGIGTLLGGLIFAILAWQFVWPRGYLTGE